MGVNVGQILRQGALRSPERVALVDVGRDAGDAREVRFAELDFQARAVAARLAALGIGPGQTVALTGANSAEFVAAWFGIAYAGCALVPIPILSAAPELRFRLEHARCRAVLFDAERAALVEAALENYPQPPLRLPLADAVRGPAAIAHPLDCSPEATALVLYTSGTTGRAKGAAISHTSLLVHTAVLAQRTLDLSEEDRVLAALPLTHSYGCRMTILVGFYAGASVTLLPRFQPQAVLALLRSRGITFMPAVPTMYAALAGEPAIDPLPALRLCLSAGAPLADEVARRAEQRLGTLVRQGYGMTEATFSTVNAPPDERVLGSVGQPVWGVELKIVDAAGREVPQGETGEVLARGHNTMSGYLHDPAATAEASRDGFVHSGDIGRLDPQGRLTIVDRIKDLIIRGGYNVYPSEVEDALATHPGVHEVAVVGRPDEYYGEEVVAVIVPRKGAEPGAGEIVKWAGERVGKTKVPREVAFVEVLPLGPSGKVQKRELREWLRDGRLAVEKG